MPVKEQGDWGEVRKIVHLYEMSKFTADEITELVEAMCFNPEFSKTLKTWLVSNTDCDFNFINLLLQQLFDAKMLQINPTGYFNLPDRILFLFFIGWRLKSGKSLNDITLPRQLQQAAEMKLENLDPRTMKILQIAAEIGWEFSVNLVSRILKEQPMEIIYTLSALERKYHIVAEIQTVHGKRDTKEPLFQITHVFTNVLYFQSIRNLTTSK
jgi:predicted ATPase